MEVFVFMPEDTPIINQIEVMLFGAKAFLVNGLINDCGKIVGSLKDIARLVRHFHAQGAVPHRGQEDDGPGTGRATRLAAARRDPLSDRRRHRPHRHVEGVSRTQELGWLKGDKMPRLVSCQAEGCAPIVRAFDKGERFAELFPNAHTVASGLRVPAAVGDFMMLDAIRASGGCAVAGREAAIGPWMIRAAVPGGHRICPETAVCFDVLERSDCKRSGCGRTRKSSSSTPGRPRKYIEALPPSLPRIDKDGDVRQQIGI